MSTDRGCHWTRLVADPGRTRLAANSKAFDHYMGHRGSTCSGCSRIVFTTSYSNHLVVQRSKLTELLDVSGIPSVEVSAPSYGLFLAYMEIIHAMKVI